MLKRLELIGFKSFADKTRFEFAPGITAIVGPNGSGKSNVVDAVKWVLGEQSAKSLRGGEMADVIFNGSSTRKSLGLAEVTMTFDNSRRILPLDHDEVQITRRVYRDGQGEYLINGQMSRLKDIKELFLGSGAGQGAYSVIEQGRVDALLTASTKDRRTIFEEAAGISRFRGKKMETLRKLERVDADLQRVRDILRELEKQLHTLQLQATKAQKYQEYSRQLQHLRVRLATNEYQELCAKIAEHQTILNSAQQSTANTISMLEEYERSRQHLESEYQRLQDETQTVQAQVGKLQQALAKFAATTQFHTQRLNQLDHEQLTLSRQYVDLAFTLKARMAEHQSVVEEVRAAEQLVQREQKRTVASMSALALIQAKIEENQRLTQQTRASQFELVARIARSQGEAQSYRADLDRLQRERQRKETERKRVEQQATALTTLVTNLTDTDTELQARLQSARQNYQEHLQYRGQIQDRLNHQQKEHEQLRELRGDLRARIEVLEQLEKSWDGMTAGVQEIMRLREERDPLFLDALAGMVADCLRVPRDLAPLIDMILGDATQRFVVTMPERLPELLARCRDLPGRVSFLPLTPGVSASAPADLPFWNLDALVEVTQPELAELPRKLLGNVLLVEDLATARLIADQVPRIRLLTRQGTILEPDGSISLGPIQPGSGFLSRKSELRELHAELLTLDQKLRSTETKQVSLMRQLEAVVLPLRSLEVEISAWEAEEATLRDQLREQRQALAQAHGMNDLISTELRHLLDEEATCRTAYESASQTAQEAVAEERRVKTRLEELAHEAVQLAAEKETRNADHVQAQIDWGRVHEKFLALCQRRDSLERDITSRQRDQAQIAEQQLTLELSRQESNLILLRTSADRAEALQQREHRETQLAELDDKRLSLKAELQERSAQIAELRTRGSAQKDRTHEHELKTREYTSQRDRLVQQLRDDYDLDLTTQSMPVPAEDDVVSLQPAPLEPAEITAMQEQIFELKQAMAKLGSVNLEALEELHAIEQRERELRSQHDDLAESQGKLLEIIQQINEDSQRLFMDLLKVVREHFLELFRKLFGGGTADIILENENDPLETGIEITARPPGKELRSISLMSGGERTMTAIALLLAIFRSRPSPFCLLDEVDAALDEANTTRLALAVRDFLDRSQFIIITHKKRTMATADVLYGITMQESGISKQVAVRFEDWPDDPSSTTPVAA